MSDSLLDMDWAWPSREGRLALATILHEGQRLYFVNSGGRSARREVDS
jgi:hypothetical protein